jgi:hypothetical protein
MQRLNCNLLMRFETKYAETLPSERRPTMRMREAKKGRRKEEREETAKLRNELLDGEQF